MNKIILLFIIIALNIALSTDVDESHQSNKSSIRSKNCTNPMFDCNGQGYCLGSNCVCNDYWATEPNNTIGQQCTYKRKQQLIAFLLQLFFGYVGAASFYIGNVSYGLGQMSLSVFCPLGLYCLFVFFQYLCSCIDDVDRKLIKHSKMCLSTYGLIYFGVFMWWIIDCANFGTNHYHDSNGFALVSW